MKVKPIFIYLGVFLVFIAAVIFFSNTVKESDNTKRVDPHAQMPEDDIHSGMKSQSDSDLPSKSNVMDEVALRLKELRAAVDKSPKDTLKIREYADMLTMAHKLDEALEYYNKILSADPKRIDILLQLTFVHFNKGDLDKAMKYNNNVLGIDKNNLIGNYNLGAIYFAKGETKKALSIWKELSEKYPKTEVGHIAQQAVKHIEQMPQQTK